MFKLTGDRKAKNLEALENEIQDNVFYEDESLYIVFISCLNFSELVNCVRNDTELALSYNLKTENNKLFLDSVEIKPCTAQAGNKWQLIKIIAEG